jgi:hypothetical protein
MLNVAGVRKIEVTNAVTSTGRVMHPIIDLLIRLKGFWEGQIQEGMSGARQPEAREVSLR